MRLLELKSPKHLHYLLTRVHLPLACFHNQLDAPAGGDLVLLYNANAAQCIQLDKARLAYSFGFLRSCRASFLHDLRLLPERCQSISWKEFFFVVAEFTLQFALYYDTITSNDPITTRIKGLSAEGLGLP